MPFRCDVVGVCVRCVDVAVEREETQREKRERERESYDDSHLPD